MNIPTYEIDEKEASEAFEAYAALRRLSRDEPALLANKYFAACQEAAYARFLARFEVR